ncbi:hypothetical protein AB9K35_18160 [Leisingera sp. XS_AS12]|uniref:hypothetical protein n=1 Tax=Leisingera sp. XS_AS12 TaxID=3241294 RepID=UPI0035145730
MRATYFVKLALASSVATLGLAQIATAEDSVRINAGKSAEIDMFGICKIVKNDGKTPINVPVHSRSEWSSGTGAFLNNIADMDSIYVSECVSGGVIGAFAYQKWSDEGGIPGHRFPVINKTFHEEAGYKAPTYSGYPEDHCVLKSGVKPQFHDGGKWPFPTLGQPTVEQARAASQPVLADYKPPETGWCNISFFREASDPNATDTVWYKVNAIIYAN